MRKIYKSCSTIPTLKFFKIIENSDYRLLIKDFDEENDNIKLSPKDEAGFGDIFKAIVYEYSEKSGDFKLKSIYKKKIILKTLVFRYRLASEILNLFIQFNDVDSLELLNMINFTIDIKKPIKQQVEVIERKLNGLKNKINIIRLALEQKFNKKLNDKSSSTDLYRQAIYLEKNLELNYSLDISTLPLIKWIHMSNISKTL